MKDTDTIDKLKEVRARYSDSLTSVRHEISLLEERAKSVGTKIETLDEVIKEITSSNGSGTLVLAGIGKYSKRSLTDSILDVVNTWGSPPGLLTPEIIAKLQAEGFRSDAKKFYASVYSIAVHLSADGRILNGKKDGKRSFMRKPKSE
jgi:hypothetical protein